MNELGYVALTFNSEIKDKLRNILSQNYTSRDYYKSPVVSGINGDVIDDLHLTIFYGFNQPDEHTAIRSYLNSIILQPIEVTGAKILSGYQDLYKVLVLEVDDRDQFLYSIHEYLKDNFSYDATVQHPDFLPHITLAYLVNDEDNFDMTNLKNIFTPNSIELLS